MSSELLFDSDKELLFALSLTQFCNPDMWAKLKAYTAVSPPNNKTVGKPISKKSQNRDWSLHKRSKVYQCLQKWHETTGLGNHFDCSHDSGLYPIDMNSSLSTRIKCIFEVILPFVSSCVTSPAFCEIIQSGNNGPNFCGVTLSTITTNWLHGLDLRYNPNFHLLILYQIKNNPLFSVEFFDCCFKFREKETSTYNVGMLYDMIPINLRHFMFL